MEVCIIDELCRMVLGDICWVSVNVCPLSLHPQREGWREGERDGERGGGKGIGRKNGEEGWREMEVER